MWDGQGAFLYGARWNSPGRGPIYAAETYSGALLEMLARLGRVAIPPDYYYYMEIDLPDDLTREEAIIAPHELLNESVTRRIGNEWYDSQRSSILLVPSVITQIDRSLLIQPRHPDFLRITPGELKPVHWDPRLFV